MTYIEHPAKLRMAVVPRRIKSAYFANSSFGKFSIALLLSAQRNMASFVHHVFNVLLLRAFAKMRPMKATSIIATMQRAWLRPATMLQEKSETMNLNTLAIGHEHGCATNRSNTERPDKARFARVIRDLLQHPLIESLGFIGNSWRNGLEWGSEPPVSAPSAIVHVLRVLCLRALFDVQGIEAASNVTGMHTDWRRPVSIVKQECNAVDKLRALLSGYVNLAVAGDGMQVWERPNHTLVG